MIPSLSPVRWREPGAVASWQPRLRRFALLWTRADHGRDFHKGRAAQGRAGGGGGGESERPQRKWDGEKKHKKNLKRQGGMKRGRDRRRMRPHFHCWWLTACHRGSIMMFDWQAEGRRGWESGRRKGAPNGSRTKHTPIQGATETLINDKEHTRKRMFSLHASDVVCRLRLVCNLLYVKNAQNTTGINAAWAVVSEHLVVATWLFVLFYFSPSFLENIGVCLTVIMSPIHLLVLIWPVTDTCQSLCSKTPDGFTLQLRGTAVREEAMFPPL